MSEDGWPELAEEAPLVANGQAPGFAPATKGTLNDIVRRIVRELRPEKIILFGSYGYGSPARDSNIDLLVIMETSDRLINILSLERKCNAASL